MKKSQGRGESRTGRPPHARIPTHHPHIGMEQCLNANVSRSVGVYCLCVCDCRSGTHCHNWMGGQCYAQNGMHKTKTTQGKDRTPSNAVVCAPSKRRDSKYTCGARLRGLKSWQCGTTQVCTDKILMGLERGFGGAGGEHEQGGRSPGGTRKHGRRQQKASD